MESLKFKNKLKELKKNNIAIIGHMGAGKSIVAKMIAKKIDFQHIDSDYEITRFTMKSINKISLGLQYQLLIMVILIGSKITPFH